MSDDDYSTMEAGPKLDEAIALLVLGLPPAKLEDCACPNCGSEMRFCGTRAWCHGHCEWIYSPYREYSQDIGAAWQVVEKLKLNVGPWYRGGWFAVTEDALQAIADTAPLAICRVALAPLAATRETP